MESRFKLSLMFVLVMLMLAMAPPAYGAQTNDITFGLIQDSADPLQITAVAIPNFSSTNVTISSSVITILLPEGTTTAPAIPMLPSMGSFINIEGSWSVALLAPRIYRSVGNNPADLQGRDIYQLTLEAGSATPTAVAGEPIELFSFRLPNDCSSGAVEVMTNDGAIRQAIHTNLGANFNNQVSASIDDAPSVEVYQGNNPALLCPLNGADRTFDTDTQSGPVGDQDSEGTPDSTEAPRFENIYLPFIAN